jgi:hypothetical protein
MALIVAQRAAGFLPGERSHAGRCGGMTMSREIARNGGVSGNGA